MPRTCLALLLSLLALAGCGGGGDSSSSSSTTDSVALPSVSVEGDRARIPVASMAEAEELCESVQGSWPEEIAQVDQVWFDIPGTGSDLTCVRG